MVKDHLWRPFELVLKEVMDICPRGLHAHSFFELVFIVQGSGRQSINELNFDFKQDDLFLIAPDDGHIFDIQSPTQFFFIRFNKLFVQKGQQDKEWLQMLDSILLNAGREAGSIIKEPDDKESLKALMNVLIQNHLSQGVYGNELLVSLVKSILILVARNVQMLPPEEKQQHADLKTLSLLQYIQSNICSPDRLRAEVISKEFAISRNYLGSYFKKQVGMNLQQYILNYKLKLIEERLLHSGLRISEIASEFGFSDKSHLNHIFKKYKGVTPSDFRHAITV